eukprot:257563_1
MRRIVPISYQNFKHPQITAKMKNAVMQQLDTEISIYDHSGIYKEFEERFADVMCLQPPYNKYCISTSSGTTALYSLYWSAFQQILIDDYIEIIVPSYTFFATVTPLLQLNNISNKIKIKFADCLLSNGNISPESLRKQITNKTKAVIVTHMWGICCNLNEIIEICKDNNLLLFQDCSHAHGATYNDTNIGNYGDCNAWSLQGKKLLTAGEGGVLSTKHQHIFENCLLIGHYNKRALQQIVTDENIKYAVTGTGLKLRMNPLGTALANEQIKNNYFQNMLCDKQYIGHYIYDKIKEDSFKGLSPAFIPNNSTAAFYALPILFDASYFRCDLQQFVETLNEFGVLSADVPSSTCPLDKYSIFQKYIDDSSNQDQFNNAHTFHQSMFKIDVWYGYEKEKYADYFLNALEDVCNLYKK